MNQYIQNELIPPLVFFVFFSLIFIFLESLVALLLNRLARRHWTFMIDVVIRSRVHHGKVIRSVVWLGIAGVVGSLFAFTPFIDLLIALNRDMKIFALLLLLLMLFIGLVSIRNSSKLDIERKIYACFFFIISLILYAFILGIASDSYETYSRLVREQLVAPAVSGVSDALYEKEKRGLLDQFRKDVQEDKCPFQDFTVAEGSTVVVKNFTFIARDPVLGNIKKLPIDNDPRAYLRGKVCTNGSHTYMLTEWGDWYSFDEENMAKPTNK